MSARRPDEESTPVSSASLAGGQYAKLPTAPLPVTVESGPGSAADEGPGVFVPMPEPVVRADDPRLAPWALMAAIVALVASFFVGWGIPLAIIAVISSIMALRRPVENRGVAGWALVLGIVATLYSAGWLWWSAHELGLIG